MTDPDEGTAEHLVDPVLELATRGVDIGTKAVVCQLEAARAVTAAPPAADDAVLAALAPALRSAARRLRSAAMAGDHLAELLRSATARVVASYSDRMRAELGTDPFVRKVATAFGDDARDDMWRQALSELWQAVDATIDTALEQPEPAEPYDTFESKAVLAGRLVHAAADSVDAVAEDDNDRFERAEQIWRGNALLLVGGPSDRPAGIGARERADQACYSMTLVFDAARLGCAAARSIDAAAARTSPEPLDETVIVQCAVRALRWLMLVLIAEGTAGTETVEAAGSMWVDALVDAAASTTAAFGAARAATTARAVIDAAQATMDALDNHLGHGNGDGMLS